MKTKPKCASCNDEGCSICPEDPPSISITKTFPSGAWRLTAMYRNRLIEMNYFFYTKKEALAEFKAYLEDL